MEFKPAAGSQRVYGLLNDAFRVVEGRTQQPAVDEIELLRVEPGEVLDVLDLEVAV